MDMNSIVAAVGTITLLGCVLYLGLKFKRSSIKVHHTDTSFSFEGPCDFIHIENGIVFITLSNGQHFEFNVKV